MPDVIEKLVELLWKYDQLRMMRMSIEESAEYLIANGVTIQRERGDIDLTRTTVLEAGDVASGRVMARSDLAELEKAMERLGRFGELFVDYKGCSRGPMGRAGGVTLEEEVLLMPKITDVDGGEWIPVNAEALHELVERSRKLREERRWIPVTERLPEDDLPEGSKAKRIKVQVAYRTNGNWVVRTQIRAKGYWYGEPDRWDWIKSSDPITHWMPLPEPPKGE